MLDMFVPNPAYLTSDSSESSQLGQHTDPTDGAVIDITQTGYYDHATQIKHAVWSYRRADAVLWEEVFAIRMFFP